MPGVDQAVAAKQALDWTAEPFEIPAELRAQWRAIGARGKVSHNAWEDRLYAAAPEAVAEFKRRFASELPDGLDAAVSGSGCQPVCIAENVAYTKGQPDSTRCTDPGAAGIDRRFCRFDRFEPDSCACRGQPV